MGFQLTWWRVAAAAAVILVASECLAQPEFDVTWTASGIGTWNDVENWKTGSLPNQNDRAVIANGGTATVSESAPGVDRIAIANGMVDVGPGGLLVANRLTTIDATGSLLVSGNGAFRTGSLTNHGLIDVDGQDVGFQVAGDLEQEGTLALGIARIGGPTITAEGVVRLGGTIELRFEDIPVSFGDVFEFVSGAKTVSNLGAEIDLADNTEMPLGLGLNVRLTTSDGSASLVIGNAPVLQLDRLTGQMMIRNVVGGPLSFDRYSIESDLGLLSPDRWTSLATQGSQGWTEEVASSRKLTESNPSGAVNLEVRDALDLGHAYGGFGNRPADEDVTFRYRTADGNVLDGAVDYVGPPNDLVLSVTPENGEAVIQSLSPFVEFDVYGYAITSESGSLSHEGWISFADSGVAGDGWVTANAHSAHLAELNPTSSFLFTEGTAISVGNIYVPGGPRDLEFQFVTRGGDPMTGTVEYGLCLCVPDCNGDGILDIFDANCAHDSELDSLLATIGSLRGDLDGDGRVHFADFLILSVNFDQPGMYTDGDINKDGLVQFADFLILSTSFGQSAASLATMNVPEPAAHFMALLATIGLAVSRRRSRDVRLQVIMVS